MKANLMASVLLVVLSSAAMAGNGYDNPHDGSSGNTSSSSSSDSGALAFGYGQGGNATATGGSGGSVSDSGNSANLNYNSNVAKGGNVSNSGNSSNRNTNTNAQGQQQGQGQLQGQQQSNVLAGSGNSRSSSTSAASNNGNGNGNGNGNLANVGNASASASNNGNNSNNANNSSSNSASGNSTTVVSNVAAPKIPVATAFAASLTSGIDTCLGSMSGGMQTMPVGLSIGGTKKDETCIFIKKTHLLKEFNERAACIYMRKHDPEIDEAYKDAGIDCPPVAPVALTQEVPAAQPAFDSSRYVTQEQLREHDDRLIKAVTSK